MTIAYDSLIEEIVQSVFATMLNIAVARVCEPVPEEHDALLATIQISGAWMGSIVLELTPQVSIAAASAMLELPLADVAEVDQQDVAAELVNMIGGNLKSMLPGPSFLSLPTIVSGQNIGLQVHNATLIEHVSLQSPVGSIQVRLYEHVSPTEM